MLVPGAAGGKKHTLRVSFLLVEILTLLVFGAIVAIVCYVIYTSMTVSTLRDICAQQSAQINQMKEENDTLAQEAARLQAEKDQVSLTLSQKLSAEDARAEEEAQARVPVGVPVSGTASLTNTLDDPDNPAIPGEEGTETPATGNPIVVFRSEKGSLITATGNGTVESVTADTKFGGCIRIDHGNGYVSVYRNAGTSLVREGQAVQAGDVLFVVGEDNLTLGYQIQQDGSYIDVEDVIEING